MEAVEGGSRLGALEIGTPDGLGPIPGLRLTCSLDSLADELAILWDAVSAHAGSLAKSPARRALDERRDRSYLEVAGTLASVYGYKLDPVNYTQGVGISGRLRLARLRQPDESPAPSIAPSVDPYVSASVALFGAGAGGARRGGSSGSPGRGRVTARPKGCGRTRRGAGWRRRRLSDCPAR